MKLKGIIHTEVEVESFSVIKSLCQAIGVVDDSGRLIAEVRMGKIVNIELNEFGNKHINVLYDQPFDVNYASTLMKLYELSNNYLLLSEYMENRTDGCTDYQTVNRLKLKK